jgi:hypothetical protein
MVEPFSRKRAASRAPFSKVTDSNSRKGTRLAEVEDCEEQEEVEHDR